MERNRSAKTAKIDNL